MLTSVEDTVAFTLLAALLSVWAVASGFVAPVATPHPRTLSIILSARDIRKSSSILNPHSATQSLNVTTVAQRMFSSSGLFLQNLTPWLYSFAASRALRRRHPRI
jgi:hypothetical protein